MISRHFLLVKNRTKSLFIFFLIIIFIIWINFFFLQIYLKDNYHFLSEKNFIKYKKIDSLRGSILDKNGKIITATKPFLKIYWNKIPHTFSNEDEEIFNFLKKNISSELEIENLKKKNSEKKILIKDKISFSELSSILEKFPLNKRIEIEIYTKRTYPLKSLACHTIGYLHSLDNLGITGLEKICEKNLSGTKGLKKLIVNAVGKTVDSEILNESIIGADIKTTLDIDIQKILEDIFPNDLKGSIIAMDPENGSILGSLSSPRFDPSIFLEKLNKEDFNELNEKKALINRSFNVTFPPGSIFKMISAIALLEEKIIDKDSKKWFCSGFSEYKGRKYNCYSKYGHGLIDIKAGLCHSCNIPFFESAKEDLTIDLIEKYANIFGFGKKTGSLFAEQEGLIPSKKWKKERFNEKWYTGETLSVSIGQGATQVTAIQIACFIGAIMTGYLVKPRILEDEAIFKNKVPISQETLSVIRESILLGSQKGTSRVLNSFKDFEIYAKTGTSQLLSRKSDSEIDKENYEKNKKLHGLLACYIKYKKKIKKDIILVILIEDYASGKLATLYAKEFLKKYNELIKND